jgi:hypothetical protein
VTRRHHSHVYNDDYYANDVESTAVQARQ